MENEKLENQKIDENELESVAGGAEIVKYPFVKKQIIRLLPDEEEMLIKANLLHFREDGTSYVNKADHEKVKDLLEKAGKKLTKKEYKTLKDFFTLEP